MTIYRINGRQVTREEYLALPDKPLTRPPGLAGTNFATQYSLQLGHPTDVAAKMPHTAYSSFRELEEKAHAKGYQVNAHGSEGDVEG